MSNLKTIFILAALAILIVSCAPATPAAEPTLIPTAIPTRVVESTSTAPQNGLPQTEADVPRVSVDEAAAAIKNGEAIVLDVRSEQAYQTSHIPGAMSVPLFNIESNPAGLNLDKDKWIITYCT